MENIHYLVIKLHLIIGLYLYMEVDKIIRKKHSYEGLNKEYDLQNSYRTCIAGL